MSKNYFCNFRNVKKNSTGGFYTYGDIKLKGEIKV